MNDASELTTRDVLQQVDRRLTSIEEGQRAQSTELRAEISNSRDELQGVAGALRTEMSSQFRWIIGLMLGGWMSTVGLILPILLRQS